MTAPTTEGAAEQPSLWRNRNLVALWSGQVVSTLGAQISGTAMPLLVPATTGSPSDTRIVGAAGAAPFLIANLPAGALVNRWNRRRILLISESVAGLAHATVPMVMWWDVLTVAHLAVVVFVQGLRFVFFGLAERAALPTILTLALLSTAVAHNEARSRGAGSGRSSSGRHALRHRPCRALPGRRGLLCRRLRRAAVRPRQPAEPVESAVGTAVAGDPPRVCAGSGATPSSARRSC
ncbi:MFS transporter [Streptomyces sp. NPDC052016]|uniref:MFS transporter n=1 Tax=Streptomyces sp. NPDC052016 TaxID=3365680 RepID=UPI0037D4852F